MPAEYRSPENQLGRKLVMVTGSGRSGTSTAAGTLKKLGLTIPQPELGPDPTNPRGFFEPRWVINFHKRLLLEAGVATLDARPDAPDRTARVGARPQVRAELRSWLEEALVGPQVVVKDPRAFWLTDLWQDSAASIGVETSYLTMLRHPAEVIGSRDTHYGSSRSAAERKARETGILAGWVNVVLLNEAASRNEPRAFVHYEDLLTDWRATMGNVATTLGLTYDADLAGSAHHPIDEFIDVNLRRVRLTWDDLDVPPQLRDLADAVWQALCELADPKGEREKVLNRMVEYRAEYNAQHAYALAFAQDAMAARVRNARRQARKEAESVLSQTSTQRPGGTTALRTVTRAARKARTLAGRLRQRAADQRSR